MHMMWKENKEITSPHLAVSSMFVSKQITFTASVKRLLYNFLFIQHHKSTVAKIRTLHIDLINLNFVKTPSSLSHCTRIHIPAKFWHILKHFQEKNNSTIFRMTENYVAVCITARNCLKLEKIQLKVVVNKEIANETLFEQEFFSRALPGYRGWM